MSNLIWAAAIALEITLLMRGVKGRLVKLYPLFYGYIACVLTIDVLRFVCYKFDPIFYTNLYWYSEFLAILASYAVVFEIYKCSFKNHARAARLARGLLVLTLLVAVAGSAANTRVDGFRSPLNKIAQLTCDLRYVEGAMLAVVLFLLGIYRISLGRNLRGLVVGFGFLVGMSVMNLALLSQPGNEVSLVLRRLLPGSFVITLVIWSMALWLPKPDRLGPPMTPMVHQ